VDSTMLVKTSETINEHVICNKVYYNKVTELKVRTRSQLY
jgi:hypothetical protein